MKTRKQFIIILANVLLLYACNHQIPKYSEIEFHAKTFPDYSGVTIPPNIAPLNFIIREKGEEFITSFRTQSGEIFQLSGSDSVMKIPDKKWKMALERSKGKAIYRDVFVSQKGQWKKFLTDTMFVANDSIDNYLVYRLIEPLYESWNKMGIYQRNLQNFDETPIMVNDVSDGNCMNCHSFSKNSSQTMLFHMRGAHGGTVIYRNGKLEKVDTKTQKTISAGVYPAWHPNGRQVAFSNNHIVQTFHSVPSKKIEVLDSLSDIMVFDAESHTIINCEAIASKDRLETFPWWSPDGKYLYYCSARKESPKDYQKIRYDLLRIAFDPSQAKFGMVDTVLKASALGKSISFPRISPDGNYVMFCMSAFGNFSIWHPESDLYLLNLTNGEIVKPEINSSRTESYHTWSSSGKWIVFSSRRIDGLYTRPYFSYFDKNGIAQKPFLLPQKDPQFYKTYLKSFNIPELVTSKVNLDPRSFSEIVHSEPVKASFKE